jgi:hypothetical protein
MQLSMYDSTYSMLRNIDKIWGVRNTGRQTNS